MIFSKNPKMTFQKNLLAGVCTIFALGAAGLGNAAFAQKQASEPLSAADYAVNKRMVIRVTAEEHAHVLTEMNDFLASLHSINMALASKDFDTVARTAEAITSHAGSAKPPVEVSFETKIPMEWKAFSRPLRQGFGAVAQAARTEPSVEKVVTELAKTTQNCVACHATFKIVSQ
jgi:cytochrome c556